MKNSEDKKMGAVLHDLGVVFRVWAPFAKSVSVVGSFNNWQPTAMARESDGNWVVEVPGATPGQEYRYLIDTGKGVLYKNDPRALQVNTSAGNSIIVDTNFDWQNDNFEAPSFNRQIIYELHVGTFCREDPSIPGTFETAAKKLDYLKDLGINMIELMPICTMSQDRGWGYATDYIYSIETLYGGRRQFLEFVKAAHQKGIGVILDVVYNHLGPDKDLDLWQFDGWEQDGHGGIYFYNDWRAETPWGATRPDYGRLEVRDYILDNVRMWMRDCHLDGLRVDSTIFIRNVKGHNNDPANDIADGWSLLQDITTTARQLNPRSITIAEDVSGNDYITKSQDEGGAGFCSQWEVTFPGILRGALDEVEDYQRNLTGVCSELARKYNGDVFERVIYSDSHDSAANGGRRLNEDIAPGSADNYFARKRSLIAAAIVLTAPGIPMLFQGQEFMQSGGFDDWQALDWQRAAKFPGMVQAYKDLINLRKNIYSNTTGLVTQNFNVLHLNEESKVMAYHRWDRGGPKDDVVVVINFTNNSLQNYSINFPRPGDWQVRFNSDYKGYSDDFSSGETQPIKVDAQTGSLTLPPYSVLILSQDN